MKIRHNHLEYRSLCRFFLPLSSSEAFHYAIIFVSIPSLTLFERTETRLMKLSIKMTIIFTATILAALLIFSSYAATSSINGAMSFTKARFSNMAELIERDLSQDIEMMELTLDTLVGTPSFLSSLKQMVRDDSDDNKVGLAAAQKALQLLYQSPMVDNYYRVTFYTRDGLFITSRADKDSAIFSGSDFAKSIINSLSYLSAADNTLTAVILAPHDDPFSPRENVHVYGVVQQVLYHGTPIGYLEVSKEYADLERIMSFIDDQAVIVQAIFDDGTALFTSTDDVIAWPETIEEGVYTIIDIEETGQSYSTLYTHIDELSLHLYIAQDASIDLQKQIFITKDMQRYALYILLPAAVLITLVSFELTSSIRRLTKKVRQLPADSALSVDPSITQNLSTVVVNRRDREIYELEQAFNAMMLRLRESTANEITLRSGALSARLSALQTQVNPHFIYNTLNIISAKAMETGSFEIIEICDQFAQMLRYSTDTRSQSATLGEEIEHVRNYLLLSKARYEDNLEYTIDVPEDMYSLTLPKLTLQPIVENALIHGFNGSNTLRRLSVTGRIEENMLHLEIRDNGVGFAPDVLESLNRRIPEISSQPNGADMNTGHIGLFNTCLRLYYYSKGAMHISIRNDDGAVVVLSMPCTPKGDSARIPHDGGQHA